MAVYLEAWLLFGMIMLTLLAMCLAGFFSVICFMKIEDNPEEGRE